jgi:hypothetical protein
MLERRGMFSGTFLLEFLKRNKNLLNMFKIERKAVLRLG